MTKEQVLEIAMLMDKVYAIKDYERSAVCSRDCMLQWRCGGDELLKQTIEAWEELCETDGDCSTQTQRFGFWVPEIPM